MAIFNLHWNSFHDFSSTWSLSSIRSINKYLFLKSEWLRITCLKTIWKSNKMQRQHHHMTIDKRTFMVIFSRYFIQLDVSEDAFVVIIEFHEKWFMNILIWMQKFVHNNNINWSPRIPPYDHKKIWSKKYITMNECPSCKFKSSYASMQQEKFSL